MDQGRISRRGFANLTAGGALAALGVTTSGNEASAYEASLEYALSSLYDALGTLREASAGRSGRLDKAVDLVKRAIAETQAALDFSDKHHSG